MPIKKEKFQYFGDFLFELRRKTKKTATAVAKELGVHPTTYASWERGQNMPGEDRIPNLALALESTRDALFARRQEALEEEQERKKQDERLYRRIVDTK